MGFMKAEFRLSEIDPVGERAARLSSTDQYALRTEASTMRSLHDAAKGSPLAVFQLEMIRLTWYDPALHQP